MIRQIISYHSECQIQDSKFLYRDGQNKKDGDNVDPHDGDFPVFRRALTVL